MTKPRKKRQPKPQKKKVRKKGTKMLSSGQVCRQLGITKPNGSLCYRTFYRVVAHGVRMGCLQPYYREGAHRRRVYLTKKDVATVRLAVAWRGEGFRWADSMDRARRKKRPPEQLSLLPSKWQ